MYLTRQAASTLLFLSIVVVIFGVFGMLKASQAESPQIIDGSVSSFLEPDREQAQVLGRSVDAPASATPEALPAVADDELQTSPPTTEAPAVEPLLSASDVRSARAEDFEFIGGPQPTEVRVGEVNIAASITDMGLNDARKLETPPADQVGWYKHGPKPGEVGSAVLAAHVDWAGQPGAFFELRNVEPGDRIEIDYDDGTTSAFEVVASRQYAKDAVPKDQLFDRSGDPRLVLVTCGGAFDNSIGHYEDNFVAFARPV